MRHSDALEAAVHLAFIRYDSRFKRAAAQVLDDQRYASRNGRFQRICFVDHPTMLLLPSRHPKKVESTKPNITVEITAAISAATIGSPRGRRRGLAPPPSIHHRRRDLSRRHELRGVDQHQKEADQRADVLEAPFKLLLGNFG